MNLRTWALALCTPILLAHLAPSGLGQTFIQGRVVDSGGNGVAGIDIDAFDNGGNPVNLSNDGTDANGNFNTEILDGPNTYDFVFNPPRGAPFQQAFIEDLFVIGTTVVGDVLVEDAFLVSGRVLRPNLNPIANLSIDIEVSGTGIVLDPPYARTDGLGEFVIALAPGAYDVLIDPRGLAGNLLSPKGLFAVDLGSADQDLGDLVLELGYRVQATLRDAGSSPIVSADSDVLDSATNTKLYTPDDNSDGAGLVQLVVPAGTYDFQFEPKFADRIVARELVAVVIVADTNLGTLFFESGVVLSGNVRDPLGNPVAKVDLDVHRNFDGAKVHTSGDDTDTAGNYAVVVPVDLLDVEYTPLLDQPLRGVELLGLNITADAVQDVSLLDCPPPSHYGSGAPGSGGFVPTIESVGDLPRLGVQDFALEIAGGVGRGRMLLFLGFAPLNAPGKGWTLLVDPSFTLRFRLSGGAGVPGVGGLTLRAALPNDPLLDGVSFYAQAIVLDSGAPGAFATTDGLQIFLCR